MAARLTLEDELSSHVALDRKERQLRSGGKALPQSEQEAQAQEEKMVEVFGDELKRFIEHSNIVRSRVMFDHLYYKRAEYKGMIVQRGQV